MPNFVKIGQTNKEISQFSNFSRWRPSAILDFEILEILIIDQVQRPKMHHLAKFRQNWSNGCGDMAIFRFFQDDGRPPSRICGAHFGTIQ